MSSGFGLHGNESRCFQFFKDFSTCMKTSDEPLKLCLAPRNDYLECLHHKKEYERKQMIRQEKENQANGKGHGSNSHGNSGGGH